VAPPSGGLSDEIYGATDFPPLSIEQDWEQIVDIATRAEKAAKIPGLRDYLIAAAWTESKGYPGAINPGDGAAALRLLCEYPTNYDLRFGQNPWLPRPCYDSRLTSRWEYSGGAWGLMPVVALSTSDKAGYEMDPARVFDLAYAGAFAADLVYRLRTKYEAVNWDRMRAGWRSPTLAKKRLSDPRRKAVHDRFLEAIEATKGYGVNQAIHRKGVSVRRYPGFSSVLHALLEHEGKNT
jgi:hypothetical protein